MPRLKNLVCQIEHLDRRNSSLQEFQTTYDDFLVEAFVAVPSADAPFSIHLKSDGYIAPGLSMFVYIDGVYQCNRNRQNLNLPGEGLNRRQTEVDFRLRQKEISYGGESFESRQWRFTKNGTGLSASSELTEHTNTDRVGTIDVVVLRCFPSETEPKGSAVRTANQPKASTKANVHEEDVPLMTGALFEGASDTPPYRMGKLSRKRSTSKAKTSLRLRGGWGSDIPPGPSSPQSFRRSTGWNDGPPGPAGNSPATGAGLHTRKESSGSYTPDDAPWRKGGGKEANSGTNARESWQGGSKWTANPPDNTETRDLHGGGQSWSGAADDHNSWAAPNQNQSSKSKDNDQDAQGWSWEAPNDAPNWEDLNSNQSGRQASNDEQEQNRTDHKGKAAVRKNGSRSGSVTSKKSMRSFDAQTNHSGRNWNAPGPSPSHNEDRNDNIEAKLPGSWSPPPSGRTGRRKPHRHEIRNVSGDHEMREVETGQNPWSRSQRGSMGIEKESRPVKSAWAGQNLDPGDERHTSGQPVPAYQVQPMPSVTYAHKVYTPRYMDSFDEPYAVFVFRYQDLATIQKICDTSKPQFELNEREHLLNLSKSELVEELINVRKTASEIANSEKGTVRSNIGDPAHQPDLAAANEKLNSFADNNADDSWGNNGTSQDDIAGTSGNEGWNNANREDGWNNDNNGNDRGAWGGDEQAIDASRDSWNDRNEQQDAWGNEPDNAEAENGQSGAWGNNDTDNNGGDQGWDDHGHGQGGTDAWGSQAGGGGSGGGGGW